MKTQHTPGPWVAVARTNAFIEIEAPNQTTYTAKKVAELSLTNYKANARLIAAAPDLLMSNEWILSILKSVISGCNRRDVDEAISFAELSIAKATGVDQ